MARFAAPAPSTGFPALQTGSVGRWRYPAIERWLEAERDQLPLWIPVFLGAGVAAWFVLPDAVRWAGFIALALAIAGAGAATMRGGRAGPAVAIAGLAMALGCALVWGRAERVAAPVLSRPAVVAFTGRVERIEALSARELVRVRLRVQQVDGEVEGGLPPVVRVNIAERDVPDGLARGAILRLRARLMPPAPPAVPGAYDFARVAWFDGLGASGRAFAPIAIVAPGDQPGRDLRNRVARHIERRVEGSAGGIASALATGDEGAISEDDAEAMRRSGLAHLLSISGLHVTAVVGATMVLVLKLLALSPALALRVRLPMVAAGAAAAVAVAYTLFSGAEVPTVRSCIAALLVLAALALGREAITLRLVAAGATIVLLLWPESIAGPSFQLSFAAVTAIIALQEYPRVRGWFARREEGGIRRIGRGIASLLLTGVAVELALTPIALFHFHKAGLYGALANIVAIPLTTFVTMPLEALALALDLVGLGAPVWWLVAASLELLLWIARTVAAAPGAVTALPAIPAGAFAAMLLGMLWIGLWRTRVRAFGLVPLAVGAGWALTTPRPDLIVTGDGRHLALRSADGGMALLRDRAGDYVRSMLGETAGTDAELGALADRGDVRCSADLCIADYRSATRTWRILATRSGYFVDAGELIAACRQADIVIADRGLPAGCVPRWLRLDRAALVRTGGVAIALHAGRLVTVRSPGDRHPWVTPPIVRPPRYRPQ
ncbi:ComEC/Rec2 family competence protein [Sphingomonas japonica]|uniref:Competence protein ComEC n=1 Tax=Sphingomonas japonica TaxID=511662 RepID=A0ABX0U1Z1_9SPHN|nr:ComEC/Rec2 family competence protein [Sphingomonas japonica]NIJ24586.1 competence protein ComEC [Sphingomonas japonica]